MKDNLVKRYAKKVGLFFMIITLIIVLIILYSHYIEPRKIEVKEYKIVNEKFKDKLHGFKIAHIADIHYGKTTFKKDLDKIISKINLTKPDILIFSGDLIDKDTINNEQIKEEIESSFKKLNNDIILYQVKGEDDLKIDNYDLIMENLGFISLNNTFEKLYVDENDYILLSGVSTFEENSDFLGKQDGVLNYLLENKDEPPLYSIIVTHEPDSIDEIDTSISDLVLSSHSHSGQIKIPFIGGIKYPNYTKKYHEDYQKVNDNDLYITSGIGTTTYGFRLFNPPSFNLYRIVCY